MEIKHAIVVNKQGLKVKYVMVESVLKDYGAKETLLFYTLADDERLVYEKIDLSLSMLYPRWTGSTWEETATLEEIAVARSEPEPVPQPPNDIDILMLAVAELYEKYQEVLQNA